MHRRSFLKRAALAAGAASAANLFPAPAVLRAATLDKVRCAVIGCGGRGMSHLSEAIKENLVAIVNVDEKKHAKVQEVLKAKKAEVPKLQVFTDYRRMFDKLAQADRRRVRRHAEPSPRRRRP